MTLFQRQRCTLCFRDKAGGRGSFHVDHGCNTSLDIDGWLMRAAVYLGVQFA